MSPSQKRNVLLGADNLLLGGSYCLLRLIELVLGLDKSDLGVRDCSRAKRWLGCDGCVHRHSLSRYRSNCTSFGVGGFGGKRLARGAMAGAGFFMPATLAGATLGSSMGLTRILLPASMLRQRA